MNDFEAANLADIHNHLVPGVDDGARTLAESLHYLRALAADGVTRLAVSPHLDGRLAHEPGAARERLDRLRAGFRELRRGCAADDHGDTGGERLPELVFSQEVLVPDAHTARRILAERGVGIGKTRFVLIEFGFELGRDPLGVVRTVLEAGRWPIIAHPERYRREHGHVTFDEIGSWKEAGALLQVNGGSVLGSYGEEVEALSWRLLGAGLADLIATDHHAAARPVSPAEVGRRLAARGAGRQARLLLSENPQRVLRGEEPLPVAPHRGRAA